MTWTQILEKAEQLGDMSLSDWKRLQNVMNTAFRKKEEELECQLKLSAEDKESVIRKLFGCIPD